VIEKDYDRLMKRTANRPLPTDRMTVMEALLAAGNIWCCRHHYFLDLFQPACSDFQRAGIAELRLHL
jgi:protoheme IX farnesyltransferase